MGKGLAQKILERHLVVGEHVPRSEIGIRIDQTLTQDATGTMAYLQFEAMGLDRVRTELSVSYVDHNTIQVGFENADDHKYLQSVAAKYGIVYSKPGNGICHQRVVESFARPGEVIVGGDSHTVTAGGLGAFATGMGSSDVAIVFGMGKTWLQVPPSIKVLLSSNFAEGVYAKDLIHHLIGKIGADGATYQALEFSGDTVQRMPMSERFTTANMTVEAGAKVGLFPSDEATRDYLKAQGRENDYQPVSPDETAHYESTINIKVAELEAVVARPHAVDNIALARELKGTRIHQLKHNNPKNASRPLVGRRHRDRSQKFIYPGSSRFSRAFE